MLSIYEMIFGSETAEEECERFRIKEEYEGIKAIMEDKDYVGFKGNRMYKRARMLILEYILECVKHDKERGDYYDEENMRKLREAGELLNKEGGMKSMRDGLVWSFIPSRYHREIDICWDGIGEWIS